MKGWLALFGFLSSPTTFPLFLYPCPTGKTLAALYLTKERRDDVGWGKLSCLSEYFCIGWAEWVWLGCLYLPPALFWLRDILHVENVKPTLVAFFFIIRLFLWGTKRNVTLNRISQCIYIALKRKKKKERGRKQTRWTVHNCTSLSPLDDVNPINNLFIYTNYIHIYIFEKYIDIWI